MQTSDVVIAGAGIIGLSAALELAAQGLRVTVLERGRAMEQASWAAAGMLAANDPENPPQLRALAQFSLALYPAFLAQVEQLSGIEIPLRTRMTLQGVPGAATEARPAGVPDLQPGSCAFIQLNEHSLDPRDLCRALPLATQAAGVILCEQTEVVGVETTGEQVLAATSKGEFRATHFVHCTGAWAVAAPGTGQAPALPVEPRKGQILSVTMPAGAPPLDCVLRTPEIYLVPRGDGRIVIGATVERDGFDRSLSESAGEALLAKAAALWPPIRSGLVCEQWTGLRPATPDGLPILSELACKGTAAARQWAATGHFRNGILLAPGSARLLRQLVLGGQPEMDLHPFRASRFAPAPCLS